MTEPSHYRPRMICPIAALLITLLAIPCARAHFFVVIADRVGAAPAHGGSGWLAEVFVDLPPDAAEQLLSAESYIADRTPDFTFRTEYIDFPAGPADALLETDAPTLGALLADDVFDVSDPALFAAPLTNFVIRFRGLLTVQLVHSTLGEVRLPALIDFATHGYGGYRTKIGSTSIYRIQDTVFAGDPLFTENALVLGLGLYPVEVTYLNRYDPAGEFGHERVGIELYSWHPGGLPWPAGEALFLPEFGFMTVTPPNVIFQPSEIPAPPKGDFDQNTDVSLADFQALQVCYNGAGGAGDPLPEGCRRLDFDEDDDVDGTDVQLFARMLAGPGAVTLLPGDFNADLRVDVADAQWFQSCFTGSAGGEEEDAWGLDSECARFDFNADGLVDGVDFTVFADLIGTPAPAE